MCFTKVRHYMKQYMPLKPREWGFKFLFWLGSQDLLMSSRFTQVKEKPNEMNSDPDFGVTSNVVLRLARNIPRNRNFIRLFQDYYYTALLLIVHLAKEGIYSLSTVRKKRLPNCKLPTEASLDAADCGTSHENMS
ncbi:hypothetical protein JTB14_021877 [Gonioctena quinquepunctata]|nr:hypothetical protein JTB14_021877 [Gonioctena quinquepunctata]